MDNFTIFIIFICGILVGLGIAIIAIGLQKTKNKSYVIEKRNWKQEYRNLVKAILDENVE